MTATVGFNLAAAQAASNRLDDGIGQPGDEALAETFERYCQQEWDRHLDAIDREERAKWLAGQCGECVSDGFGPPCDEHYIDADHDFTRGQDT